MTTTTDTEPTPLQAGDTLWSAERVRSRHGADPEVRLASWQVLKVSPKLVHVRHQDDRPRARPWQGKRAMAPMAASMGAYSPNLYPSRQAALEALRDAQLRVAEYNRGQADLAEACAVRAGQLLREATP